MMLSAPAKEIEHWKIIKTAIRVLISHHQNPESSDLFHAVAGFFFGMSNKTDNPKKASKTISTILRVAVTPKTWLSSLKKRILLRIRTAYKTAITLSTKPLCST